MSVEEEKGKGGRGKGHGGATPFSPSPLSTEGAHPYPFPGRATASPFPLHPSPPIIHSLGLVEYQPTWDAMRRFTAERTPDGQIPGARDEIWLVQHPPTYTQGQAGKPQHLLRPAGIPVVKVDRGGQITYHGPGQIVAYLLLDLRRWKINVRELVRLMERAVIDLLGEYGVAAQGREDAPGVYVGDAKIAALGLKIKHGCCYHGLALNVDMDLTPFANINPCGQAGLRVTQCCELGITAGIEELQAQLSQNLIHALQRHLHEKMLGIETKLTSSAPATHNPQGFFRGANSAKTLPLKEKVGKKLPNNPLEKLRHTCPMDYLHLPDTDNG